MRSNRKKAIVFLGGKRIGVWCLEHLLEQQQALGYRVIAILPSAPRSKQVQQAASQQITVRELAHKAGIPVLESLDELLKLPPVDILISVQYHKILKSQHIRQAREIAVNLHMAPLPEYRGCNQFSFAIINKEEEFGTTLHRLEEGIDSGAIIAERRFPIPKNCWVDDLYKITERESLLLFQESLPKLIRGEYQLIPQDLLIPERGTSYHRRSEIENLKYIDLNWPREKIERHIRATSMPGFEPPYTFVAGRKVHLVAQKKESESENSAGRS